MVTSATRQRPGIGTLVEIRGQRWVVSEVDAGEPGILVDLRSVEAIPL
ncbi:hypothetical protein ABZ260_05045 [Streptosporangium sp. NPDC006013]